MKQYFFNAEGLRFSLEYLRGMRQHILDLSPSEQSEFVDMITYELVKHKREVHHKQEHIKNWTCTIVGNLAFVMLYHTSKTQRQIAKNYLERITHLHACKSF